MVTTTTNTHGERPGMGVGAHDGGGGVALTPPSHPAVYADDGGASNGLSTTTNIILAPAITPATKGKVASTADPAGSPSRAVTAARIAGPSATLPPAVIFRSSSNTTTWAAFAAEAPRHSW